MEIDSGKNPKINNAKALQSVCLGASFTVEAAFVVPLFLFAALAVVSLFPMLMIQMQINHGLQYAARLLAVSYTDSEDETDGLSLYEGEVLFETYMTEHGYVESVLEQGLAGISFSDSDISGDEVLLAACYEVKLPISFWSFDSLPVRQYVSAKKWAGANPEDSSGSSSYVYITPSGSAYHQTADCAYLKLSVKTVSYTGVANLRNKSGGIYYACSCYSGGSMVYITDYGTEYHGDLSCSSLKRTIYRVSIDQVGDRHACAKCY